MRQIFIVFFVAIALVSCGETWRGVKKDTGSIAKSIGKAGTELGEKIDKTLSDDEKTEEVK